MEVTEVKFKKQKVWFEESAYNRAVKDAEIKITLLDDCINWVKYHIKDVKTEEFRLDMVSYFLKQLGKEKKEFAQLKIRPEKVADLLDINVRELTRLEALYNNAVGSIKFTRGKAEVDVSKETFTTYTETQKQNEELAVANDLINAIKKLQEIRTVYPIHIVNSFGGFLNYHQGKQQWRLNTSKY
jgi:hypothetical protein